LPKSAVYPCRTELRALLAFHVPYVGSANHSAGARAGVGAV